MDDDDTVAALPYTLDRRGIIPLTLMRFEGQIVEGDSLMMIVARSVIDFHILQMSMNG